MEQLPPQDKLGKLIVRWNRVQQNRTLAPPFAGILFLIAVLPVMLTVCNPYGGGNNFVGLIFCASVSLGGFLGFASLQWRFESSSLIADMLQYDDLRLVPILIYALDHHYRFEGVSKRLALYLDRMTLDDSALLTEKEYHKLERCLLDFSSYTFEVNDGFLQIAILRTIQKMGHTPSIATVETFLRRIMYHSKFEQEIQKAAKECLNTLLEIRKQAKHTDTLLRPSHPEATPETLLRAAMPTVANENDLLKPDETPQETKKNQNLIGQ